MWSGVDGVGVRCVGFVGVVGEGEGGEGGGGVRWLIG